jgi:recombination protein RecT
MADTKKENKPAVQVQNITEKVLEKITALQQAGALRLPKDYSAENALKSAYLVLQEVVTKDGKPVLQNCTQISVANSLLDMVVQGLSPMKKQCYFIAYGQKLTLSRSYQGAIAISKRIGLKNIVANVVYEGDKFTYEVDSKTGRKKLVEHIQNLEGIDITKIKGAYAVVELENGTIDLEVMNIKQIKNSWLQGAAKGNSKAHENFTDEMCKKTVINRACKGIINSSDDSYLYPDEPEGGEIAENIKENANKEIISFEEGIIIDDKGEPETKPENKQPEKGSERESKEPEQGTLKPGF